MAGGLDSRPDVGDFLTQAWFSPPPPPPSSPHGGYEQGPDAGGGHEPASERERLIFELINVLREAKMDIPKELMKFGTTVKRKPHKTYGDFGPKADLVGLKATKKSFSDSDSDSD